MVRMSDSTTMTIKIDKSLKASAQATAAAIGIPISTLISMYLKDFSATGRIDITAGEQMTPQTERIIEAFRREVASDDLSPIFTNVDDAVAYLSSL